MTTKGDDRRAFLRGGYKAFLGTVVSAAESGVADVTEKAKLLRPPGAIEEAEFLKKCNLCGKCWEACEHGSIKQFQSKSSAVGTPIIIPEETPCYLCDPPVCSEVCEEGALLPVGVEDIKIGVARFKKSTCLAAQRIDPSCDYCYDRCPLKDKAITFDKGPVVNEDNCAGCGVCEYFCISNPKSIKTFA